MIIAKLLWILRQWSVHVHGHDTADSWLLKDHDAEANEVMESGNKFHSVIVLAAKDFWNRVEAQRLVNSPILSFYSLVVGPLTGLRKPRKSSRPAGRSAQKKNPLYYLCCSTATYFRKYKKLRFCMIEVIYGYVISKVFSNSRKKSFLFKPASDDHHWLD